MKNFDSRVLRLLNSTQNAKSLSDNRELFYCCHSNAKNNVISFNVYETVTNRILEEMDKGVIPWHISWIMKKGDYNPVSKTEYHGINVWLLNLAKEKYGYKDNRWMTFLQIKEKGYHLKKDSVSAFVIFWKILKEDKDNPDSLTVAIPGCSLVDDILSVSKEFPILKYYRVFNGDCIEGLPEVEKPAEPEKTELDTVIDSYLEREKIEVSYGKPSYLPLDDKISIPEKTDFTSIEEYYCAITHEIIHSTGSKSRLNRFNSPDQLWTGRPNIRAGTTPTASMSSFASESYSKEELIAELGASFICAEYGLSASFQNSVAYLQGVARFLASVPHSQLALLG